MALVWLQMWNGKCSRDGNDFRWDIEEFKPTFAEVLVRCNPEGDIDLNRRPAFLAASTSQGVGRASGTPSSNIWRKNARAKGVAAPDDRIGHPPPSPPPAMLNSRKS